MDDELYYLILKVKYRNLLRTVIIETYFEPNWQSVLIEQGEINTEAFFYSQKLLEEAQKDRIKDRLKDSEECRTPIRDQGFRHAIVKVYDHRCAFCGIRMLTPDGHTVLTAAHIIPWSISRNDSIRNGISLCRLCHWTFDEGLLSVSSKKKVIVSPQLASERNVPGHLLTLADRGIIGPTQKEYWPDSDALFWHQNKVFRKR